MVGVLIPDEGAIILGEVEGTYEAQVVQRNAEGLNGLLG